MNMSMSKTTPTPEARPSMAAKARDVRRGLGEVFAFFWAGFTAFVEFCLGRWPELPGARRRRKPPTPNEGMSAVEKIAPYPMDD